MLDNIARGAPKLLSSYIYKNRIENFVLDRSVWGYISTYPTPLCPILTHTYFLFIYISSLYIHYLFLYSTPFSACTLGPLLPVCRQVSFFRFIGTRTHSRLHVLVEGGVLGWIGLRVGGSGVGSGNRGSGLEVK